MDNTPISTPMTPKPGVRTSHRHDAGGREYTHLDPVQPLTALFPDMAAPRSSPGRSPLLKRWTDCHTAAGGYGKKMYLDLVVDYGAALFYSDSSTTANADKVMTRLGGVVSQVSAIYYAQLGVQLVLNTVEIRTTMTNEAWNVYAVDDSRWSQKNITSDAYIEKARAYRLAQVTSKKGATQQTITRAFLTDTVGIAYIAALCDIEYSTGFSSINHGLFLTLAHELGHNFGATHTFESCTKDGTEATAPLYTVDTGGIMDYRYSHGFLGPESDSNGELGFHSLCNKKEMCAEIRASFSRSDVPQSQCWADATSFTAVCGNNVTEPGEECDVGTNGSTCCVNCKFATGATCAYPSECCVNCQAKTANTACGAGGRGHCGPEGTCIESTCGAHPNTEYNAGVTTSTVCRESCLTSTGTSAYYPFLHNELCRLGTGATGYCKDSTCRELTYDWATYPASCICDAVNKPAIPVMAHCKASSGAVVAESKCAATAKPTHISCCAYEWSTTTWSTCGCSGSQGTQTRAVTCVNKNYSNTSVNESLCTAPKPASTQSCAGCTTYAWKCATEGATDADMATATTCISSDTTIGFQSTCPVSVCGSGTKTRRVACVSSAGVVSADSECVAVSSKPALNQACSGPACTYDWRCGTTDSFSECTASHFGACSYACGSGTQTRTVTCVRTNDNTVAEGSCVVADKPLTSQSCNGTSCTYAWKCGVTGSYTECAASHFGPCGASCGSGTQTRTVTCVNQTTGQAVDAMLCDTQAPDTSQPCSDTSGCPATYTWRCAPTAQDDFSSAAACSSSPDAGFGACQVSCPTGTQTRFRKCWSSVGEEVDDSLCSAQDLPILQRSCVGAATFANIEVLTAAPTAGAALELTWCYHGPAQDVDIVFDGAVLGTVNASSGTATITLPWGSKRSSASVLLLTIDATEAESPSFPIASRCDSILCTSNGTCDEQSSVCKCKTGWSGDDCAVSPCDVAQCENNAVCANDGTKMGQCQCLRGFQGPRCRTRVAYGVLTIALGAETTSAAVVHPTVDEAWQTSLIAHVSMLMGLSVDRVSIARMRDVEVEGQAAVEVVFAFASAEGAAEADMAPTYAAWETTSAELSASSSIANVGLVLMAEASMYDPNCTGNSVTCPTGQDPFMTTNESPGFDMWIAYYIIIGVGSVLLIAAVVVGVICCRRRRGSKAAQDVTSSKAIEMAPATSVVYNTRVSVANTPPEPTFDIASLTPVVPPNMTPKPAQESSRSFVNSSYAASAAAFSPTAARTRLATLMAPIPPASGALESPTRPVPPPRTVLPAVPPATPSAMPSGVRNDVRNDSVSAPVANTPARPGVPAPPLPVSHSARTAAPIDTVRASLEARSVSTSVKASPPPVAPRPSPLPPGWVECKTEDGKRSYYWHAETRESVWERPRHK